MTLSVGTDTEFFLKTQEGVLVSATEFIEGSKHRPTILSNGGNVTHDNVALEFATPPVTGVDEFVDAVKSTLKESLTHLPEGVKLFLDASVDFPEDALQDERCREFGCSTDYDAWELCANEVDAEAPYRPFRSCGGHLHIGYVEGSGNDFLNDPFGKVAAVKALDIVAGVPSVIMDGSLASIERRKLYGKAGCHRPTDYGVEYRVLGNFWTISPLRVKMIHSMAVDALSLVREERLEEISNALTEAEIVRVINEGDLESATKMWDDIIRKEISSTTGKLFDACVEESAEDIYLSWNI